MAVKNIIEQVNKLRDELYSEIMKTSGEVNEHLKGLLIAHQILNTFTLATLYYKGE